MKRIAFALLALSLGGALAFGQDAAAAAPAPVKVGIGMWGRQIVGVGNQDSGYYVGSGTSWGASPRIGLSIGASTENYGFVITPEDDGGAGWGLTDQNKAWVSPMAGLTVETGVNLETDTWRGTGDFGSYDWIRLPGEHGDSVTFFRVGEANGTNVQSDINYNKDGIGAWAMVNQPTSTAVGDLGSNLQAGAAYTVPSVGTIKAQYIGYAVSGTGALMGNNSYKSTGIIENTAGAATFGIVQAAFNLKLVDNLYEEVGVIVPTSASAAGYVFNLSDVISYKLDKVTLHGLIVLTSFNGDNNTAVTSSALGLEGHVGADYDLGDALTIDGDVLYVNQLELNSGVALPSGTTFVNNTYTDANNNKYYNADETGFSVGLTKGFGNADIGIGFEWSSMMWNGGSTLGTTAGTSHWVIPVRMTESF
jgi:hypothetical protein